MGVGHVVLPPLCVSVGCTASAGFAAFPAFAGEGASCEWIVCVLARPFSLTNAAPRFQHPAPLRRRVRVAVALGPRAHAVLAARNVVDNRAPRGPPGADRNVYRHAVFALSKVNPAVNIARAPHWWWLH